LHPEYALGYRELYHRHWWWRAREKFILDALERLCPNGAGGGILDVGCGDGLIFEKLIRFGPVEGIEMDQTAVNPTGPWASRIRLHAFDDTFEPGHRYALVLLLDVLEHFDEPLRCLRRAVQLVAPNGAILVTVPAFRALWTSHDVLNRHFTRYTRRSLTKLAWQAGARVETCRYFFQWTFPIKLALRLKEAVTQPAPEAPRIPSEWVNRALFHLSLFEQKTLSRWPIPFGSSLLAVLRSDALPPKRS
jgi:2-polyprenyl-3-methyl-5-hydroxy-6-metoxy-1,4-benzoquinol methylase